MHFPQHDIESAPEAVRSDLEQAEKAYGAIPNLYRGLASNPATLKIYLAFNELLAASGSLTPVEKQVVYITVSAWNGCTYCVAAHSVLAGMAEMPAAVLDALRDQAEVPDGRLEALRRFTLSVLENRGHVPAPDMEAFEAAGFSNSDVLEVLTITAQKTISNYFNHIAGTPLDEMFQSQQWLAG